MFYSTGPGLPGDLKSWTKLHSRSLFADDSIPIAFNLQHLTRGVLFSLSSSFVFFFILHELSDRLSYTALTAYSTSVDSHPDLAAQAPYPRGEQATSCMLPAHGATHAQDLLCCL